MFEFLYLFHEAATPALLHRDLSPFFRPLERHELRVEERVISEEEAHESAELRLRGRYGPGTLVFVALELESEALGCPLRVAARRTEVR